VRSLLLRLVIHEDAFVFIYGNMRARVDRLALAGAFKYHFHSFELAVETRAALNVIYHRILTVRNDSRAFFRSFAWFCSLALVAAASGIKTSLRGMQSNEVGQ